MKRLAALIVALVVIAAGIAWWLRAPAPAPVVSAPPAPAPSLAPPPKVEPAFTGPETKEIVLGDRAESFIERRYEPPFALVPPPDRPDPLAATSVEAAMTQYAAALTRADWDGWMSLWDESSRAMIEANVRSVDAEKGGSMRAEMIAGWEREYRGRPLVLSRRLDLPGAQVEGDAGTRAYAVVYFRRADAAAESLEAITPLALALGGDGIWRFSHALASHPVYFYESLREEGHVRVVSN